MKNNIIFTIAFCICICLTACGNTTNKEDKIKDSSNAVVSTKEEQDNSSLNKYINSLEFREGTITTKDNKILTFYAIAKADCFSNDYFAPQADYLILTHDIIKLYTHTKPNTDAFQDEKEIKDVEIAYWSLKDGGVFPAFYYDVELKRELSASLPHRDASRYTKGRTYVYLPERIVMSYEDAVLFGYIERNSNKISFNNEPTAKAT